MLPRIRTGLLVVAALHVAACHRASPPRPPAAPGARPGGDASPPGDPAAAAPLLPQGLPWPTPPAQSQALAAPAGAPPLPADLESAAAALFALGLADPRGCEYRAVELTVGDVHGGPGQRMATRAWVLPAGGGRAERFAVAWNGLLYPVQSVGDAADLAADVRAASDAPPAEPGMPALATDEARGVAARGASLVRAALLWRLGERALAASLLRAARASDAAQDRAARFDQLASEWAWSLRDRALCAHMRGDRATALASVQSLNTARDAITREHARLAGDAGAGAAGRGASLDLGPGDEDAALERDLRRRGGAPPAALPPPGGDVEARVAALVVALDEVAVAQAGQPGGVPLGAAREVVALIAAGDAAVAPLIDVLERDGRLTRSVYYWRDFTHDRHVLPVWQAALVALQGILQTEFRASPGAQGERARVELAAAARAYWARFRGAPPAERFYRVLADDHATIDQWTEAAEWLARPTRYPNTVSAYVSSPESSHQGALAHLALEGEALRTGHSPSVTELLVQRMDALWSEGDSRQDIAHYTRRRASCALAQALGQWDARGALAALARETERAHAQLVRDDARREVGGEYDSTLVGCLTSTALLRAIAGDPTGLDTYAAWITTVEPWRMPTMTDFYLEPLWYAPTRPAINGALDALFGREDPRWVPLAGVAPRGDRSYSDYTQWLSSPLRAVPAFRDHVLRPGLADRAVVGEFTVLPERRYALSVQGGGGESGGFAASVADLPPPGTRVPVRRCDYYAFRLADHAGGNLPGSSAPAYQLFWPQARRDAALADVLAWAERAR